MTDAPRKLFIIDLTYTAPVSEIDATTPDHATYLDEGYSAGVFLASGRKSPRTGGVIIATETTLNAIRERAETDLPASLVPCQRSAITRPQVLPEEGRDDQGQSGMGGRARVAVLM